MEIKLKESKIETKGIGAGLHNLGAYRHALGNEFRSQVPKIQGKYITGLDKYTPEVKGISDEKLRKQRINELDKLRASLEARLGVSLDQDTEEGKNFWADFEINFDEIGSLNKLNPMEELLSIVIKANVVFPDFPISISKEDLEGDVVNSKDYYIVDNEKELNQNVSKKKLYAQIAGKIQYWYDEDENKLRQICQIVLPRTISFTSSTNKDYLFDKLIDYIDGKINIPSSSQDSQISLLKQIKDLDNMSKEALDVKATVDLALRLNIISRSPSQGDYYNRALPDFRYGKTLEEVYSYFRSSENIEELGSGKTTDKEFSLKKLIYQKEKLYN